MTKLHGLHGSERERVFIDVPPAIINNPPWSAIALRNDTGRGYAEAGEVLDIGVWEHYPLAFVDHVHKFLLEVVQVLVGRFVRAPCEGALDLTAGPWRGGELDRRAAVLVVA
jgi:hypothetical protein